MYVRSGLLAIVLIVLLLPSQARAQSTADANTAIDPHPLATADTSSPRDTLLSFDTNATAALQAWRAGMPVEVVLRQARLAFATFDFSHLPLEERQPREIEAALLLKEILDRIELPPEEAIPGDKEVTDKDTPLTRWTIPDTQITITKIEKGSRAGEFLFNPESVDRLDEFYERAKHLPYKPGALVGIYDTFRHSPGLIVPASWSRALSSSSG